MSELDKMRAGDFYDVSTEENMACIRRRSRLLERFHRAPADDDTARRTALEELIPGIPASSTIIPPFHCDYGTEIRLGEAVFINANCTLLDGGGITVGNHTLIGPGCQLLTPIHPTDYLERRKPIERAAPIRIGDDCWLGGGVTVCPGVTIGDRCIIGAGSVVVHDIPDDSLAVGNPAVVKRKLREP